MLEILLVHEKIRKTGGIKVSPVQAAQTLDGGPGGGDEGGGGGAGGEGGAGGPPHPEEAPGPVIISISYVVLQTENKTSLFASCHGPQNADYHIFNN